MLETVATYGACRLLLQMLDRPTDRPTAPHRFVWSTGSLTLWSEGQEVIGYRYKNVRADCNRIRQRRFDPTLGPGDGGTGFGTAESQSHVNMARGSQERPNVWAKALLF